jgi:prepilin-type N-terminal cleavage/methylation domain-containing protein
MDAKISSNGFALIELMIATVVFSVILLLTLGGFMQIGRTFYKGVTISRTENTIRTITDNLSSDIRVSPVEAATATRVSSTGVSYFCIRKHIYYFRAGVIYDRDSGSINRPNVNSSYGLKRDNIDTVCNDTALAALINSPTSNAQELLGEKMRVSKLQVSCSAITSNRLCELTIRIAYGDNDLLYSPSGLLPSTPYQATDAVCKGATSGTQFCATADINTSVLRGGN